MNIKELKEIIADLIIIDWLPLYRKVGRERFKDYDTSMPLAIIHFTNFRYDKGEET